MEDDAWVADGTCAVSVCVRLRSVNRAEQSMQSVVVVHPTLQRLQRKDNRLHQLGSQARTRLWMSSMKRMILRPLCSISTVTALRRSSNSPGIIQPAAWWEWGWRGGDEGGNGAREVQRLDAA